jgi:16S rRNA (guanine966-N2)-methyltransferase
MRITGGALRSRALVAPRGQQTRPTSDRVREALFSMLTSDGVFGEPRVLDLYAGSGALGLEALSRGAARCIFAETDPAACRVIRRNLEQLRLAGGRVFQRDAVALLRGEIAAGTRHELVLADPPYERWAEVEPDLAGLLPAVIAASGLAVVETSARIEPQLPLDLVTSRRYGSARLTVFA